MAKRRARKAPAKSSKRGGSYKKQKNINITVNSSSSGGGGSGGGGYGYPIRQIEPHPNNHALLDEVRKIINNQVQHPTLPTQIPQIFSRPVEPHIAEMARPEFINRPMPGIAIPQAPEPSQPMEEQEQEPENRVAIKKEDERRIVIKKEKKKSIIDPKDELRMVVNLDKKRPNSGYSNEEESNLRYNKPSNRKLDEERMTEFSDKYLLAISLAKRKAASERQKSEAKQKSELKQQYVKKEDLY